MTIYTRAGDRGQTRLAGGLPMAKDAPRLEALGTVDELSAALGLARAEPLPDGIDRLLGRIQCELMEAMAELGSADPASAGVARFEPERTGALEEAIDAHQANLGPLTEFLLPGGCRAGAALHLARTICRRAERRLVALGRADATAVSGAVLAYFNRLSDLLFVLARTVNGQAGRPEPRRRELGV